MPLHMRLPKLKGFKNPFRVEYQVVNLDRLAALFPEGGAVTSTTSSPRARCGQGPPVKVLGNGDLDGRRCRSRAHAFSASAKEKIDGRRRHRHRAAEHGSTRSAGPSQPTAGARSATRQASRTHHAQRCAGTAVAATDPDRRLAPIDLTPAGPPGGAVLTAFARRSGRRTCARSCCSRWASSRCSGSGRSMPDPGRRRTRPSRTASTQVEDDSALRPGQPVQRRRAAAAVGLRARDHAVHHGEHHPAAAHRGHPAAGGPEEGGPGRPGQDHAVHPLPDDRPGDPAVDRHRRARPEPGQLFQSCNERRSSPTTRLHDPHRWSSR